MTTTPENQGDAPEQPTYGPPPAGTPYSTPPAPGAPPASAPSAPAPAHPQYVQPQYGQPQYAQPQYAQPQYAQVQYTYAQQVPAGGFGTPGPGEPFDGAFDPSDLSRPLYGASFGQAVKRFFKNYANFSGRASRSEYWWVMLFVFLLELVPLVLYIVGFIMMMSGGFGMSSRYRSYMTTSSEMFSIGMVMLFIGIGLLLVIGLGLLVPSIALMWRRLHDANQPGPMYFLGFIPYAGAIILFVFSLLPPKPQGRRFDRIVH